MMNKYLHTFFCCLALIFISHIAYANDDIVEKYQKRIIELEQEKERSIESLQKKKELVREDFVFFGSDDKKIEEMTAIFDNLIEKEKIRYEESKRELLKEMKYYLDKEEEKTKKQEKRKELQKEIERLIKEYQSN